MAESLERRPDSILEHRRGEPLIEYNPEYPPEKLFEDLRVHAQRQASEIYDGLTVALFGGPGTISGVAGGAQVTALQDIGLRTSFDVMAGTSTFVPTLCYFSAGHPREGTTIYSEECCGGKFINRSNLFIGEPIVDTEYLGRVFSGAEGSKRLRTEDMLVGTRHLVAVADAFTGEGRLLEIGKDANAIEAIRAAIAIPLLSNGPIDVADGRYEDAGLALPLPIEETLKQVKGINRVVVLTNRPYYWKERSRGDTLSRIVYRKLLSPVKRTFYDACDAEFERNLALLKESHIPYLVVWPFKDYSEFHSFEQNPQKVRAQAIKQESEMRALLGRCLRTFDAHNESNVQPNL